MDARDGCMCGIGGYVEEMMLKAARHCVLSGVLTQRARNSAPHATRIVDAMCDMSYAIHAMCCVCDT